MLGSWAGHFTTHRPFFIYLFIIIIIIALPITIHIYIYTTNNQKGGRGLECSEATADGIIHHLCYVLCTDGGGGFEPRNVIYPSFWAFILFFNFDFFWGEDPNLPVYIYAWEYWGGGRGEGVGGRAVYTLLHNSWCWCQLQNSGEVSS